MQESQPSRTALRVALRRAAHQIHDDKPLVFDDPLAVRILGAEYAPELARTPDSTKRPFSAALRAFMVARARLAEDGLQSCYARGIRQYLVLGAGLDTFAYRNRYPDLRVYEVDHPATQAWKRSMLASAGIAVPHSARLVPVDFERQSLREELAAAGLDCAAPTMTAWLGVVPYLTPAAFRATLRALGEFAEGSCLVFDYSQPREVLPEVEQRMLDSMADRVKLAGEPFQLFFTPETLRAEIEAAGMRVDEDLSAAEITARLFQNRTDGLRLRGKVGRVCCAVCA